MGRQGPFVTHRGFIGGAAVHSKYPIVAIVGFDRELYLLNRVSGNPLWQVTLQAPGVGAPRFVGNLLLIPTGDGLLTAYDINSRKVQWKRQFSGLIRTPVTVDHDMLFVCDGTNSVYALNRENGELIWQHRRDQPKKFSLQGESKPLIAGDRLIMGYSDGRVIAFNARRGEKLWERDLAPQVNMFEDVDADLIAVNGTLYAASAASGLYALS